MFQKNDKTLGYSGIHIDALLADQLKNNEGAATMKAVQSAVVASVAMILGISQAHSQEMPTATPVRVDIKSQPLTHALSAWAQQTGLQLIVGERALSPKITTPRVVGRLAPTAALEQLLAGTPLRYQFVDSRTVMITSKSPSAAKEPAGLPASNSPDAGRNEPISPQGGNDNAQIDRKGKEGAITEGGNSSGKVHEIVVTGTHIRNGEIVGSNVLVIDRAEIDRSGHSNTVDLLKALPQNFGGGSSEDNNSGRTAGGNFNKGTGINLRGLGSTSTLVLINGRRLPGSGTRGAFVDISSIPVGAIERIEVLPDGASALYGSDAIGGVVNFILRNDFQGAETRIRLGTTTSGGGEEVQFAQLLGHAWSNGSAMLGYQYSERDEILNVKRRYSESDDYRQFGGSDFRSIQANPGNILDPTTGEPAYAIPTVNHDGTLNVNDLIAGETNYQSRSAGGTHLLPENSTHNVFATASTELGARVEIFAEGLYARREINDLQIPLQTTLTVPITNPYYVNPFGGAAPVRVAYSFLNELGPRHFGGHTESYSGTAGLRLDVFSSWQTRLVGSYGEERLEWQGQNLATAALTAALRDPNPSTAFNPFCANACNNPETLATLIGSQRELAKTATGSINLTADGPLFRTPAGEVRFAVGLDYREENRDTLGTNTNTSASDRVSDEDRLVRAAFAELIVPVIKQDEDRLGLISLELSAAGRHEEYSDFGSATNPKLGLQWQPIKGLVTRATWGTSFKAPLLAELTPSVGVNGGLVLVSVPDPESPTGRSTAFLFQGNNPELQEETATSWTVGIDAAFSALPNFAMSATYYSIKYEGQIARGGPVDPRLVLVEEDRWSEVIQRNPSRQEIEALCRSPYYNARTSGLSVEGCVTTPNVAAIADVRLRNLAATRTQGMDIQLEYSGQTRLGTYHVTINTNHVFGFEEQVSNSSPMQDVRNSIGKPAATRVRGGLTWARGPVSSTLYINYIGATRDTLSIPIRRMPSWSTFDLQASYQTPPAANWLGDLKVSLSATNLLNNYPPFANVINAGYDTANADPLGRVVSVYLTKNW